MAKTELRAWSSLTDAERQKLLADYQPELDRQAPTCSFETKLERMRRWLAGRGVCIAEAEIRPAKKP
jgi:predicted Fe-S protein YdhL (DUF1289 family)